MKYLAFFTLIIVLFSVFTSSLSKSLNQKNLKDNPSSNPLPKLWTTGHISHTADQIPKKYHAYNKKLAEVHHYQDTTLHLMKKAMTK